MTGLPITARPSGLFTRHGHQPSYAPSECSARVDLEARPASRSTNPCSRFMHIDKSLKPYDKGTLLIFPCRHRISPVLSRPCAYAHNPIKQLSVPIRQVAIYRAGIKFSDMNPANGEMLFSGLRYSMDTRITIVIISFLSREERFQWLQLAVPRGALSVPCGVVILFQTHQILHKPDSRRC